MDNFLLHAGLGFVIALAVFMLAARMTGERGFSLPAAPLLVSFLCGIGAHFLSPWATLAVLIVYAAAALNEAREIRRAQDAQVRIGHPPPPENSA